MTIDRSRWLPPLVVLVVLAALPLFGSEFFVTFVMTRTFMLGMAAATIVFLSGFGGMTSMAQFLMFGIAGFMIGNLSVSEAGSKGLKLGLDPWLSVVLALVITTVVALILGAVASRTTGIYYLMLTFIFAVIGFFFFGQVTTFSGFGGITGIDPPPVLLDHPIRLYFVALALSFATYFTLRAVIRTPFGLALQGIRDEPVRMAALGWNVPLHRTLAFAMAGFLAGVAGVLNVWWNGQIDPRSISIGPTIDLLIIAVIGGMARLEGAWIGAFVFVAANNYLRSIPLVDRIGITEARFNTVIGALVLLIVIASPDGITGLYDRLRRAWRPIGVDQAANQLALEGNDPSISNDRGEIR
ncbi:MAG: branched-chain amino acid ABC transporter permease [Actinomycetota bacterium]